MVVNNSAVACLRIGGRIRSAVEENPGAYPNLLVRQLPRQSKAKKNKGGAGFMIRESQREHLVSAVLNELLLKCVLKRRNNRAQEAHADHDAVQW